MATTYFVYKLNWITNIGGVTPRPEGGVDLGLAVVNDLYLGRINVDGDVNYLTTIASHTPIVITEQVARGLPLVNITEIQEQTIPDAAPTTRPLNATELADKAAAQAFLSKLEIRTQITANVADLEDLVADQSKRLALLDRIVLALFDVVENAAEMPADIKAVATQYKADQTAKLITDTIDINGKTLMENYTALRDRNNAISDIMKAHFAPAV